MVEDFLRALVIGFAIAAAIGPIGILCIRRSIAVGFWGGFTSGLGAAVADGVYGMIAAFGLVAVDKLSGGVGIIGKVLAGVVLLYLGGSIYRTKVDLKAPERNFKDMLKGFIAVFFLTMSNPMTIVAFIAVFAGLGVTIGSGSFDKLLLISGIFLGSAVWWVMLAGLASGMRKKLDAMKVSYINKGSGLVIMGFGVFSIVSTIVMI